VLAVETYDGFKKAVWKPEHRSQTHDQEGTYMTRAGAIMNGLAVLILITIGLWGANLYPQLPEAIPTHWNASGEADAFSNKSIWSAFGVLISAAVTVLGLLVLRYFLARSKSLVPAEHRAYDLSIGYGNLSIAVMFGWISVMSWLNLELGPLFLALSLLGGVPFLIIIGLHLPAITRERNELMGPEEPSLDPKHWRLGGFFYSNADDPRVFVPKPPHTGMGMTANLATPGGRLFMIALALLILAAIALPFLL
jgi:uncharacterized membrane protein